MSSNDDTHLVTTGDFLESWRGGPTSASGDILVGATLNGTYVVERLLGEGGMGRVYLARHTRIAQKRVAVKVLHSEFAGNTQVLARFQREAEAAAAISHPNVVSVLDIDVTKQGMPYLVCEYLEGVDLSDHLREVKRLDVPDALSIARQLCRGLAAAHARGVIHRDLKPPNIFLVGDFKQGAPPKLFAKIVDFGLSRFHGGEQNLTKTGVIMGTPSYMAPEQARGKPVDQRVDVYGLGTILYTVLTGRAPYEEESAPATILALLNSEPPRPRSLVPTIPAHIEVVIERAMAKNADDRYPDMAAFEAALDALPSGRATTSVQPAALVPAPPSAARMQASAGSAADVEAARPRLLLALAAAASLLIVSALVALAGVELATGYRFDRVELLLILVAIAGTSLTPGILWFLHIRRRIWDNSSRVLSLLVRVRASVLAGAVSYALLVLTLQLIDGFLSRVLARPPLATLDPGWRGWNLLLPAAAFVIALSTAWRRHLLATLNPGWRRLALLVLLTTVTGLVALAIVYAGTLWRAAAVVPAP